MGILVHEGQFRDQKSRDLHEKSRDLSNYEIFPHKILSIGNKLSCKPKGKMYEVA